MAKAPRRRTKKRSSAKRKYYGPQLSIRVTEEEKRALRSILPDAQKIRPYVNFSDLVRELLGLTYTGLITPEMRKKLRDLIERLGTGGREHNNLPPVEGPSEYKHKSDGEEDDDVFPIREVA
jgi:hypothetical protein